MSRIRVGVAGAGWVAGARHLPSYLRHPDVDVVAVYDRRAERAQALAAQAGRKQSRGDVFATDRLSDFLDQNLDLVSVATSPWSHHDIAVASLTAGAHVFTEKPMAMSLPEATAMADAALGADRLLGVSHNFLFSSSLQSADRVLGGAPVDYALGVQYSAETRRLPTWYADLPGGLMFDEAPHMIYTMGHFLGGALELDHARATLDASGHPRTVELLLRGRTGVGQVAMVFCAPVSEWHVQLSAAHRSIELDLFRDIEIGLHPDGAHEALDIARSSASMVGGHVAGFAKAGARLVTRRQFWGHDVLIHAFVDATRGRRAAPVPVEDALGVVALTDQVLQTLSLTPARQLIR